MYTMRQQVILGILLLVLTLGVTSPILAQPDRTPIECGTILESETNPIEQAQDFEIRVPAGTTITGRVEPLGTTFNVVVFFLDQGNSEFAAFNRNAAGLAEEINDFIVGSSNPIMRIVGFIPDNARELNGYANGYSGSSWFRYFGAYTIYLGCILRDGTVIEPGMLEAVSMSDTAPVSEMTPNFSGVGYPGLAPIDFSTTTINPLIFDIPLTSSVAVDGVGATGFSFDGSQGDILQIDARRLQGNLGVGFVVFAQPNIPVFIAGPVGGATFTTQVELPQSGSYVVGLFRMTAPEGAQATAFQITATLNP